MKIWIAKRILLSAEIRFEVELVFFRGTVEEGDELSEEIYRQTVLVSI